MMTNPTFDLVNFKRYKDSGYLVSPDGKVYSEFSKRFLTPYLIRDGYLRIALRLNGKGAHKLISRLVCETFLIDWDEVLTCNHKDGNKLNNHISNLEMVTQYENMQHAFATGLLVSRRPGEQNGRAKITLKEVKELRSIPDFIPSKDLVTIYSLSHCQIWRIRRGDRDGGWAHV